MRRADAAILPVGEEIGIVLAPDQSTGVEVYRIVLWNASEIGKRQKARRVGVISKENATIAVNLIRIDLSVLRMSNDGMLAERRRNLVRPIKLMVAVIKEFNDSTIEELSKF